MGARSIWLAASLLLVKLVLRFIPCLRLSIRSRFLLKNEDANNLTDEQQQAAAAAANLKLLGEEDGTIEELPDHLIESILLPLLPVKSLLRFRSVSKRWDSTISSPTFSAHHMINTSHVINMDCSAQKRFLFPSRYTPIQASMIPDPRRLSSFPPPRLVEKRLPYKEWIVLKSSSLDRWFLQYMSSCNGLVCFTRTRYSFREVSVQIWNLSTSRHKQIAELPDDVLYTMRAWRVAADTTMLGFGYDPTINDFKIVFIFRSASPHDPNYWITRVMTLKTDTWRALDNSSSNSHDLSRVKRFSKVWNSVAVAGAVFWIVTIDDDTEFAILKFGLAEEKFELISFPDCKGNRGTNNVSYPKLSCHGGSLYLIIQNSYYAESIDLWMLPEAKARSVWGRVTTITIPPPCIRYNFTGFSSCVPLGLDCNGHVIIVVERVLYAYILKENIFVKLDSSNNCEYIHLVQMQTLASP